MVVMEATLSPGSVSMSVTPIVARPWLAMLSTGVRSTIPFRDMIISS